ncbi:putative cytochrome P450 [Helianthus anomalus]
MSLINHLVKLPPNELSYIKTFIVRFMSFTTKMKSDFKNKFYITMINYWSWWWEVDNDRDALARAILTISVPILAFLWYKWTRSFTNRGRKQVPPGPYGLPVVGYLPFLSHNLHERFTEMAHRYGPIFSLRLGSKFHVVVNSMDLAKVVARELDQTFANRNPPITALTITYGALDVVWSNNNAHWRNMRKLLVSQVLSNANLDAFQGFRIDEVRKSMSNVYAKIGTPVDINEIAFDTELNVVTSMLWGCSSNSGDIFHGFREVEFKIIELLGAPNISDFIPMLSWFDLQGRKREMQKQREHLDRIFESVIEERIRTNSRKMEGAVEEDGRKDFLQIMLELMDQKDASTSFDIVQIKALLFDILTATTDTASTMVEWVMAEILRNPDVKTKIQEELTKVVGMDNIVEEAHLPKLKYLDAVVKETFRIHPPLPLLIQRCPDESCMVDGYQIPKGSIVYINVWAIQHDPKNWTNPLEFKPERFLNGKWDYSGTNMKFLPFGSGRRICPGVPLGEKMLMYILASLLHSFEWILPKDEEFELSDEFGFVTKKRKPLVAIPFQRLSDSTLYE